MLTLLGIEHVFLCTICITNGSPWKICSWKEHVVACIRIVSFMLAFPSKYYAVACKSMLAFFWIDYAFACRIMLALF